MHLEILDNLRINLLKELSSIEFLSHFNMGGGTGLSLQLGLRKSFDFDFFTDDHFNPDALYNELAKKFGKRLELILKEDNISTLDVYIDNVQVSFIEYKYPILNKTEKLECIPNILLLSIEDIACMKVVAIIQRGTKKDFYDLYFILKEKYISEDKLITLLLNKYKKSNVLNNFCYSMSYFEDANGQVLPESFITYSWDDIKNYFLKLQINLMNILKEKK